jgi:ABC-type nickel/cobalt efflux system permease component RcnA
MNALARRTGVLHLAAIAACLLQLALGGLDTASAHPLGNFSINQYARLEPSGDRLVLTYVLEMAEIPAFRERDLIDANRDAGVDEAERQAYLARKVEDLLRGLSLLVNGRPVELQTRSAELSFPPGQGGLPLLRVAAVFDAAVPAHADVSAVFRDENNAGRLGWKEIVARPGPDATLVGADVPASDLSDELRRYPEDMLQSPLQRTAARLHFRSGAPLAEGQPSVAPAAELASKATDPLAALAGADIASPLVFSLALLAAAAWGSLHALSPGHGKTVVAAYLLGAKGTVRHAAVLGLSVTATHTAAVYALGLIALYASQYILPERLYPWLSALSGALVVALGAVLVGQRIRVLLRPRGGAAQQGAHAHPHHGSEHADVHAGSPPAHTHAPGHAHVRVDKSGEEPMGWRRLLALGVSAGLLPCPSALVLMLGAISLGRVGFGLLLVVAFSLGLAGVLTGFGLLLVYARRVFVRLPETTPLFRLVPTGSAVVILAAGVLILARSLAEAQALVG